MQTSVRSESKRISEINSEIANCYFNLGGAEQNLNRPEADSPHLTAPSAKAATNYEYSQLGGQARSANLGHKCSIRCALVSLPISLR